MRRGPRDCLIIWKNTRTQGLESEQSAEIGCGEGGYTKHVGVLRRRHPVFPASHPSPQYRVGYSGTHDESSPHGAESMVLPW
jgi:hypothetical protein